MASLLTTPLTPSARRLVLTPAPSARDDPRIRRYRLARLRLDASGGLREERFATLKRPDD
jgi:hypothetical protein